jgi:tetratricopeptide (TPR) repeat protein/predicted Ser/Thr protein kinase
MDSNPTHTPRSAVGLTIDQRPAAQYAALWRGGQPGLDAFLAAAGPLAPDEFTAVLCTDQRCRWRSGERATIEDYLRRLPGVPPDPEAVADLIFNEFVVREQLGERPDSGEYLTRFPEHAAVLRDQFDLHRALVMASGDSLPMDDNDGGTIASAVSPGSPRRRPNQTDLPTGSFGDYELFGEVARGGMGVVYRARQKSLNRIVALKMILAGQFAGPDEVRRFRAEAEAVALLDHPHILPVYEVGDRDGRHFFAMKFVDGGSLAGAVKKLSGEPRAALELLVKVCKAVHFAHQRGILHRDLKPANVLLDRDGTPFVADFGLAKWLEGDDSQTMTGTVVGTPSYIAPEQARAERPLTTAADVYSLGAILYELLTGRPPFRGDSTLATLQMVQEEDPVRPTDITPTLDRDLETIALKCLQKDPARRYGSAQALADDLNRWLRGEPIAARPVTASERAMKWARRRPAVAALTVALGVVTIASVIGLVGMFRQSEARRVEAEAQRDEAREQRQRTRQALDDMIGDQSLDWLTTQKKLLPEQRKFLERALAYYREFAAQAGSDDEARHLVARANHRVGRILGSLGQPAEAEVPLRRATELYAELAAADPTNAEYRKDLTNCHTGLVNILQSLDRHAEAEASCRAAVDLEEQLMAELPANPDRRKSLARAYHNLATTQKQRGQGAAAEPAYRKALDLESKLAAEFPKNSGYREDLARSYNNLAVLLEDLNRPTEAEAAYRAAIDVLDRLAADHPGVAEYRKLQAGARGNLGAMLDDQDKRAAAEKEYRAAIAINERLAAEYPSLPLYRLTLATNHFNLANSFADAGRVREAEVDYRIAITLQEKLVADHPRTPEYRADLAASHVNLGIELAKIPERRADAEAAFRASLALAERLNAEHPTVPRYAYSVSHAYQRLGDMIDVEKQPQAALELFNKAIKAAEPFVRQTPDFVGRRVYRFSLQGRALTLGVLGRHAEAVADWRALLAMCEAKNATSVRAQLADSLARSGDLAAARTAAATIAAAADASSQSCLTAAGGLAVAAAGGSPDAERCAVEAIGLMRLAVAKGFVEFNQFLKEPDLAGIRGRVDFVAFLWDAADGAGVKENAPSGK